MDIRETVMNAVKSRSVLEITYKGNKVYVAPTVYGLHTGDLKIFTFHLGGFSKSKFEGTSTSDFRLYDLDKITSATMMLDSFTTNLTREYLTRDFTTVYECYY